VEALVTQRGKGIFLGKPVGTPTGLCIGRPGLLIFAGHNEVTAESLVLDLTALTIDMTHLQVQFHG
jgi:hypothetical protein